MTKIVNGVLVPSSSDSGSSSDDISSSSRGLVDSCSATVTICGTSVPRYALGTFIFVCLLMGGVKGAMGGAVVVGALYVVGSKLPQSGTANGNQSSASSSKGMKRMPLGGNIKGISDLPKSVPKNC
jgi:hypothetical protein